MQDIYKHKIDIYKHKNITQKIKNKNYRKKKYIIISIPKLKDLSRVYHQKHIRSVIDGISTILNHHS